MKGIHFSTKERMRRSNLRCHERLVRVSMLDNFATMCFPGLRNGVYILHVYMYSAKFANRTFISRLHLAQIAEVRAQKCGDLVLKMQRCHAQNVETSC